MKAPETGRNRTGLATASAAARKGVASMVTVQPAGDLESELGSDGIGEIRARRARESDAVGSIPPPTTMAGKVKSAIGTLSGASMSIFMDRLGQRLAFERQGSRLYEGLIAKLRAAQSEGDLGRHAPAIDDLIELHDEELQHFLLLTRTITDLGGDPTAQTPAADVSAVAGAGLPQVVNERAEAAVTEPGGRPVAKEHSMTKTVLTLIAIPALVCAVGASATATTKKGDAVPGAQAFLHEAAVGGMAEVELGKLAQQNASSAAVKQFATRISRLPLTPPIRGFRPDPA